MNIFSKLINIDSYKDIGVSNLNPSFFACYLKKLHDETKQAVVVVFSNMYEANKIYNELLNITSPLLYQVDNLIEEMSYASSKELKLERLNTLKELATDPNRIVLTDVSGYLGHIESKKNIISNVIIGIIRKHNIGIFFFKLIKLFLLIATNYRYICNAFGN